MDMINISSSSIGVFPIYGILIMLAIVIATIFCYVEWRKKGEDPFKFWLLYGWVIVLSLFGARWWYLIFNPSSLTGDPIEWFLLSGGRSVIGSIVFAAIGTFIFTKFWMPDSEWRRIMSIAFPHMLLAQAIARWGNFFNEEVYGLPIENLDWLPSWIADNMFINGEYRQPLFLYESLIMFGSWLFINSYLKTNKKIKPGVHGSSALFIYGTTRSIMELFRDNEFIMKWGNFPTSFMLAIILSLIGLFMIIYYQFIYEDKTAVYFQFKSPAKNQMYINNLNAFFKFITFRQTKPLREEFNYNKVNYNNIIKNIKQKDIEIFITKIKKDY